MAFSQTLAQEAHVTFYFRGNSDDIKALHILRYDVEAEKMVDIESGSQVLTRDAHELTVPFTEPTLYKVYTDTGHELRIAVEQQGTIYVTLGDKITLQSEVANVSDFNQRIQALNDHYFSGLIKEYDSAMKAGNRTVLDELEARKEELLVKFIGAMEQSVREMGPSALAYDALSYFDMHKNRAFLQEMAQRFSEVYPKAHMTQSLQRRIAQAEQLGKGKQAPIFSTKEIGGATIKLEDFQGSFVLLDFWASWCRACRVENPKLVPIYESFNPKGFNIISVSIDTDTAAWKKAIQQDGITWLQVHDPHFSIYKLYMLSSLPANFLLDPQGTIIARNINAKQLEEKLDGVQW